MERRTRLALVVLVGLILLLIGIWIFLQPLLDRPPAAQPPPIQEGAAREVEPTPRPREAPVVTPTTAAPTAQSGILALENRARGLAERMGSGTAFNGFLGFDDVMVDATSNGKLTLKAAQAEMRRLHPATTPYGTTAKAVTARVDAGNYGDASIVVTMDVFVAEDAGSPDRPTGTVNRAVTMTFVKQADGNYLLDAFTWK